MNPKDNKMMEIGRILEEARRPGGKIPRRNRFPLYVRMAHWDDGQGMPEIIYEDPRTFKPEPGPNGEIHTWGLFPYLDSDEDDSKSTLPNRRELNCNIPDIDGMAHMQRKMRLQFSYNDNEPSPEDQFVNVLIERKRRQLSSLDLKDLPKRDVILKINLYGVRNSKGEHRIWRRFRVSAGIRVSVLQDKVITPIMGWTRNLHAYTFTDFRDGSLYGPENATSVDVAYAINSGYKWLSDDEFMLAHLFSKEGDRFGYMYDLGDRWFHEIVVERILPAEKSDGRVEIIAGDGACPGENMKGCWPYRRFMNEYDASDPATQREKKREILECPNYKDFRKPPLLFNPYIFDMNRAIELLGAALESGNSVRAGMKSFVTPLHPDALSQPRLLPPKKGQSIVKTFDPNDAGGFWEETMTERRDRKALATCALCGKPSSPELVLKSCGGCRQMLYCSKEHQKEHWKKSHKNNCSRKYTEH